MRSILLAIAFGALPAHADLYRWVDPETGAVKFSSSPPPWYGDPERERGAPRVEVIPSRGATPAAVAPAATGSVRALEERRADLLRRFADLPANVDLPGVRQQVASYQAISTELDRLDPAGAARRRAEEAGVLDALRRRLPK